MIKNIRFAIVVGYLSSAIGILGSIILQPMILDVLKEDGFVVWNKLILAMGYISTLFVGVQTFLTVEISKNKENMLDLYEHGMKCSFILLFLACLIGWGYNLTQTGSMYIYIFILIIVMKALNEIALSVFAGFQLPHIPRIYDLAIKVSNVVAIVLICFFCTDVYFSLLQYFFIQYLISFLLMVYFIKCNDIAIKYLIENLFVLNRSWFVSTFDVLRKTMPFLIISIPQSFIQTLDNFIVLNFQDKEISVSFVFYLKVYSILFITQNIIFPIYYPIWSKYISQLKLTQLKQSFIKINLIMLMLNVLVTLLMLFCGETIFKAWVHHEIKLLSQFNILLLALSVGLMVFKISVFFLNNAIGVHYKGVIPYWIEFALHIILGVVFVELYDLAGLMLASSLSTVIGVILVGSHVSKQIKQCIS